MSEHTTANCFSVDLEPDGICQNYGARVPQSRCSSPATVRLASRCPGCGFVITNDLCPQHYSEIAAQVDGAWICGICRKGVRLSWSEPVSL